MNFEYEQSKVIESVIFSNEEVHSIAHHSLEQTFGENIHNQIEYVLIQTITAINKGTGEKIYTVSIAYKYLVSDLNSSSSSIVEAMINDSFDRFYQDNQKFLKNHFLAKTNLSLEIDYDHYSKVLNDYISTINN